MKKMTAVVLALGLTVPAQAWTLFPVRKEIVTVKETNYTATIAVGVVGIVSLLAGIAGIAGIGYMYNKNNQLKSTNDSLKREAIQHNDTIRRQNAHMREQDDQLAVAGRNIDKLRGQRDALQRTVNENSAVIRELEARINTLKETPNNQDEQIRAHANEIKRLKVAYERLNRQLVQVQQELGAKNNALTTANQTIQGLREANATLRASLDEQGMDDTTGVDFSDDDLI
jgi:methyl-accepting chemotaxis protein